MSIYAHQSCILYAHQQAKEVLYMYRVPQPARNVYKLIDIIMVKYVIHFVCVCI